LKHRRLLPFFAALATAMATGVACADIYRYVNSEGVTRVTTTRPAGRAEVVVKGWPGPPYDSAGRGLRVQELSLEARSRYVRQIQAAAHAVQIDPALIHAVISAESAYNPLARSPAGAVGLMQLMPGTAARYNVTNRLDPDQNIRAGTRYLGDLLLLFDHDLLLALAAYNAGENAVLRHGNRLPPYRETLDYVPRVMAYYRKYRAPLPQPAPADNRG
jgi:soluble lytic murein transglycosylase-like protein